MKPDSWLPESDRGPGSIPPNSRGSLRSMSAATSLQSELQSLFAPWRAAVGALHEAASEVVAHQAAAAMALRGIRPPQDDSEAVAAAASAAAEATQIELTQSALAEIRRFATVEMKAAVAEASSVSSGPPLASRGTRSARLGRAGGGGGPCDAPPGAARAGSEASLKELSRDSYGGGGVGGGVPPPTCSPTVLQDLAGPWPPEGVPAGKSDHMDEEEFCGRRRR